MHMVTVIMVMIIIILIKVTKEFISKLSIGYILKYKTLM